MSTEETPPKEEEVIETKAQDETKPIEQTPPEGIISPNRPRRMTTDLSQAVARLPFLDQSRQELKDIHPDVFLKEHLTKITMSQNYLTTIPKDISKLKNLVHLDLSYNRLHVVPAEFCQLENLEELQLGGNSVSVFPAGMKQMKRLKKLSLTANKLRMFPTQICELPALQHLDVTRNQFSYLPLEIRYLTSLTELKCRENNLKNLTPHIGMLPNLTYLNASDNQIASLPGEIGDCINLTDLNLSDNCLTAIPITLVNLMNLTNLNLSQNQIREIPVDICQERFDENGTLVAGFVSLTNLNLSNNFVGDLPQEFFDLTALQDLNLTHNKLNELSSRIENLKNLTRFFIGGNVLSTLPSTIGTLQYLDTLNLFDNRLYELPPEITHFASLGRLFMGYNLLSSIPLLDNPEYLEWENLEELHISGNKFGKLPNAIGNLWSLKSLIVANADLTELPHTVSFLTNLTILDVSENQITQLPKELASLSNLQRLNVSRSQITSLDDALFEDMLDSMQELNLSVNKLSEYPPNILRMIDRGIDVYIDFNPVDSLPSRSSGFQMSKRYQVGFSEMIGRRTSMEDAIILKGGFMGRDDCDLYCIFDGHGGTAAAHFARDNFPNLLEKHLKEAVLEPIMALRQSLLDTNEAFREFQKGKDVSISHAGATALVVLIIENHVFIANLGDTRCVLGRGGEAIRMTEDHKPVNDEDRINALGGWVTGENTKRINGMLAVARSLGDFYLEPFVIAEPFLAEFYLGSLDEYLVLACDGVWDEVHDQLAVDICRSHPTPSQAAVALRDHGFSLNSDDNLSVIVVKVGEIAPFVL